MTDYGTLKPYTQLDILSKKFDLFCHKNDLSKVEEKAMNKN